MRDSKGLWSDGEINELHLAAGYEEEVAEAQHRSLVEDYGAPPFTVLDARQGYWKERKRQWLALGIVAEEGRGIEKATANAAHPDHYSHRGAKTGGSSFDPFLTELLCAWFCPAGGGVLDPFAGGSVRGIVTAKMGLRYTGIELREEQVAANIAQAKSIGLEPLWVCGDSARLDEYIGAGAKYDMIFTCPPYYNLEEYSGEEADGSAKQTYTQFLGWYLGIFQQAVKHLRANRFLVVVVGDLRDKRGCYRNFVFDSARCFLNCGLHYYNEAVFVTPIGSLPIRTAAAFPKGRKLGKGHQNVLVFYKGDPREIGKHFPREVQLAEL